MNTDTVSLVTIAFQTAINDNRVVAAEELLLRYPYLVHKITMHNLCDAIANSSLVGARWILSRMRNFSPKGEVVNACFLAAPNVRLDMIKLILLSSTNVPPETLERLFEKAVRSNNLDIVIYFSEVHGAYCKLTPRLFADACTASSLQVAQWLYTFNAGTRQFVSVTQTIEDCFYAACRTNRLNMAQWLFSVKPSIDLARENHRLFRAACFNNNLTMAQWLWSVDPSCNLKANGNEVFLSAVLLGHWEVAQWLCTLFDFVSDCTMELSIACESGNLPMVQWLITALYKSSKPRNRIVELILDAREVAPPLVLKWLNSYIIEWEELRVCAAKWDENHAKDQDQPPKEASSAALETKEECATVTNTNREEEKQEEQKEAKEEQKEAKEAKEEPLFQGTKEEAFLHWCEHNNVAKLEQLLQDEHQCMFDFKEGCRLAALHGSLPVLDHLLQRKPTLPCPIGKWFYVGACNRGDDMRALQWLEKRMQLTGQNTLDEETLSCWEDFTVAVCFMGCKNVAAWMLYMEPLKTTSLLRETHFQVAVQHGHLHVAQWLLDTKPSIDVSAEDEKAFLLACANGHLAVAQWLLQVKPSIDVSAKNEGAFCHACGQGHLQVAQWLLQVKPSIDVSAQDEEPFYHACAHGHMHVAQWLLQIKPSIDVSAKNGLAFRMVCSSGNLKFAQWFLQVKPDIDIFRFGNLAFCQACENGHLSIAQWLFSLNVDSKLLKCCLDQYLFRNVCKNGHQQVAAWMAQIMLDNATQQK